MDVDTLIKLLVAIGGSGGLLWGILAASRKRPQIVLHIKGLGVRESTVKDSHDVFFHIEIRNRSPEINSIDKLIFTIWNTRLTEFIWEAWNVELFKPDRKTNWTGDKIDTPLVLNGKAGMESIAVLTMPDEVYYRYLGDRMPGHLAKMPGYEKPFPFKLLLRDSFGNHYTGGLNTEQSVLVDYESLRHMSVLNTDISNDCAYGRPRVKHIRKFYFGRIRRWFRFKIRIFLYYMGIVSKV